MRKIIFISTCAVLFMCVAALAQNNAKSEGAKNPQGASLSSQFIDDYGKDMDKLIADWSKRIGEVIKKYELTKIPNEDIRVLPYQTDYEQGDGYIQIEKHFFIKDPAKRRSQFAYKDITGITLKRMRVYTSGDSVSKIVTNVVEKYFSDRPQNEVIIEDPSPTSEDTDDILITHIYKGKTIIEKKKMGDIRNDMDATMRNDIKSDFLVPNLNLCYKSLMFIAEAYYSSLKDTDKFMSNFLKDNADLQ